MHAAHHGRVDALRALVELGADVAAADERGVTALMQAAAGGHVDALRAHLFRFRGYFQSDR